MSRFAPYLGIPVAMVIGVLAAIFANVYAPIPPVRPAVPAVASTTVSVLPNIPLSPATLPSLPKEASTTSATSTAVASAAATSTPKVSAPKVVRTPAKAVKPATPVATPVAPVVAPVVAPTPVASSGSASLDQSASFLRAALVNILCYAPAGSALHSISGSGVFIDSKGIILTNAHVAQYFLLADRGVSCTIRTGSPAVDAYKASLIYISPAWIHANPTVLTQTLPTGTGEYDFALLAVTKSATSAALPSSFPSVPLAGLPSHTGTPVVIASYGAQFLETSQIQSSLFPTIVFGSVKDIFTFGVNTIDVLALGGSAAAQEGSSGGGVADASGSLVGTITTSTVVGDTSTRSLVAITASYVRLEYAREMNASIDTLLSAPTASSISDFVQQIPSLEALITAQL